MIEEITGHGSSDLELSDTRAMIVRRSSFICPRTLIINADKAACDISRDFVQLLKNSKSKLQIEITVLD